jgi:hypothetical protein
MYQFFNNSANETAPQDYTKLPIASLSMSDQEIIEMLLKWQ